MGQQSARRNAEMSMNIGVNRVVKSYSKSVRTENRNCKLNSTRKIVVTFPISSRVGMGGFWVWAEMEFVQRIQINMRSTMEQDK